MFKFRHIQMAISTALFSSLAILALRFFPEQPATNETSHQTRSIAFASGLNRESSLSESAQTHVCQALNTYPKPTTDALSFHSSTVSSLCQPFMKFERRDLDHCGDQKSDPYLSKFTWPTRLEMSHRGKVNVFTEPAYTSKLPELLARAETLRHRAIELCCADEDVQCRAGMMAVKFEVCKPSNDPNSPDPCIFGGTYRMPGVGYDSIFRAIAMANQTVTAGALKVSSENSGEVSELRSIASANLQGRRKTSGETTGVASGSITLSSYISVETGAASMDPVILHELGHACSMVKMEDAALDGSNETKALRAAQWLDSAKHRCDPNFKVPEAVDDFWESVGETRELSSCLKDLAVSNQKMQIDKPCRDLCPGHYLEESVGIAFSLLLGDLDGSASAAFPNTCDHVRDGQHPMVSDVAECLMQNSARFRSRVAQTYGCGEPRLITLGSKVTKSSPVLE